MSKFSHHHEGLNVLFISLALTPFYKFYPHQKLLTDRVAQFLRYRELYLQGYRYLLQVKHIEQNQAETAFVTFRDASEMISAR